MIHKCKMGSCLKVPEKSVIEPKQLFCSAEFSLLLMLKRNRDLLESPCSRAPKAWLVSPRRNRIFTKTSG